MEVRLSTGLTGSRYSPVASSCEYGTEPSGSIKGGGFIDQLSNCQILLMQLQFRT
jgi:hypothetical protein